MWRENLAITESRRTVLALNIDEVGHKFWVLEAHLWGI